jgi:dienelactone hydrolase
VQGGTNATGYYVWDVIRGLDYLETRTDADMSRIGLTGASGGGLATLYAFAAEDRFKAAVPVVYMSSMELAPDNGCLCNHVPATCQVGDRSDVIAIQAPKPVYLFGAEVDPEFPPDAMRLTQQKMAKEWALFGKEADAMVRIYPGGHDYSQPMREAMVGFFNKHLNGVGDGSPVAQPPLTALNPEDRSVLVLNPPPNDERMMRDLSLEYLANAPKEVSLETVFAVNGGKPTIAPSNLKLAGAPPKITATFEAEPGLTTPTIMITGADLTKPVTIVVSDDGKAAQIQKDASKTNTRLYVDILGKGELSGFELRYPVYLGRSPAYVGGVQIAGAAKLVRQNGHGGEIHLEAHGPLSSLAAMYAGLFEPSLFNKINGNGGLREWSDALKPGVTPYAVQPRAHLLGSLDSLRKRVKNATWTFAK